MTQLQPPRCPADRCQRSAAVQCFRTNNASLRQSGQAHRWISGGASHRHGVPRFGRPLAGCHRRNYVIDNRPGADGGIALGQLAKSPANGTVMMLAHMSAASTTPHTYLKVPYNTLKDFDAVGLVGDLPFVLVVNAALPVQDLKELIQYAKANPGKLNNAASGNGTVSHLAMEEIKRKAGLKITHIPYKGSVAGLTDVIAGNVSMALETASAVRPHVESGLLRAIVAGSAKRLGGVFANVPTLAEQGIADLTAVTWLMLLYPSARPRLWCRLPTRHSCP